MTTAQTEGHASDRRWYPPDCPEEWAISTRDSMFASIRGCIAHAIGVPTVAGAGPYELEASDEIFRRLHACAQSCAESLHALGQDGNHVVATVLAAAVAAAEPDELHPAVIGAIEQWCRDASRALEAARV